MAALPQQPAPAPGGGGSGRPRYYFTLLFWFRKGRQPGSPGFICCRLTVDKARHDFATGLRCHKHEWDAAGQQLLPDVGQAPAANALLAELRAGLTATFAVLERQHVGRVLAPARVRACYREPELLTDPPRRASAPAPSIWQGWNALR